MLNNLSNQRVICVIPARLNATRFPKKILKNLLHKPLLQWVYEAATSVKLFHKVIFAIDSLETAELLKTFNAPYVMTSIDCPSGTHRLLEVSKKIDGDIWVNWQADEPFVNTAMIENLLSSAGEDHADAWTLKKKITEESEILSPNIVKVVSDNFGNALYFSRSPIPYHRDPLEEKNFYKHVGIYAYTKECLKKIAKMPECALENKEKLEQLRFLYYGLKIKVHETAHEVFGIDTIEDLQQAEQYARNL